MNKNEIKITKKTVYPKTSRITSTHKKVITEKLDGANLVIAKLNGELLFCQRNLVFQLKDNNIEKNIADTMYKNLPKFIEEHYNFFYENLQDNVAICGEFLGMGVIKYPIEQFKQQFYMFATARINEYLNLSDFDYYAKNFKYIFKEEKIPEFIGSPKFIGEFIKLPTLEQLDIIYENYCHQEQRLVEGFVINDNNQILKYVRNKNGKLVEHYTG